MGTINNMIIIEDISRGHKLNARHKYEQDTVNIGRSYRNDLIISDQHVCSEHIQVTYNGEHWQLNDLNSINGSFLGDRKTKTTTHIIQSGDIIRLGKSYIRFIFPNQPIEKTLILSPFENIIDLVRLPIFLTFIISLFIALSGYVFYLGSTKTLSLSQFFVPAFSVALGFALWPLSVALISHLTKKESRVWHQIGISFIFFNVFLFTDFIENIILFNTSNNSMLVPLLFIFPITLTLSLVWLNCYIGFTMTHQKRLIVSISLVTLLFGSIGLISISKKPKFSPYPHYDSTILPPSFLLIEPATIESFMNDAERTFSNAKKSIADKNN